MISVVRESPWPLVRAGTIESILITEVREGSWVVWMLIWAKCRDTTNTTECAQRTQRVRNIYCKCCSELVVSFVSLGLCSLCPFQFQSLVKDKIEVQNFELIRIHRPLWQKINLRADLWKHQQGAGGGACWVRVFSP